MKRLCMLVALTGLAGCLTSQPPAVACWDLEFKGDSPLVAVPKFGAARLLQVTVASPADTRSMMVRRANGSVAFDPYNEFAAMPSQLWRKLAWSALSESGVFGTVVGSISTVRTDCSLELEVLRWDLDCRADGVCKAEARLLLRIVKSGELVRTVTGGGAADAGNGDYGAAFSLAASQALSEALAQLR